MLELQDTSLTIGFGDEEKTLLHEISALFPQSHFCAVIGPSGCGKSTLLKMVAGLRQHTGGTVHWEGRDLVEEEDLEPHEIGYVPQFSIAYDHLTVWESVETAMRLRLRGLRRANRDEKVESILQEVGLDGIADREVRVLSGGQKRRLALALEMVSAPSLLLCDEVTSGLDPKAEDEIVRLMKQISQDDNCIVLSVTHSLRHLDLYDSVLVLHEGHLAYHGPADFLLHYFDVTNPEDLFPRLAKRSSNGWGTSWMKHRAPYYEALTKGGTKPKDAPAKAEAGEKDDDKDRLEKLFEKVREETPREEPKKKKRPRDEEEDAEKAEEEDDERDQRSVRTPGLLTQFSVLLGRRWKIFLRDRGGLWLQLALLFGFPCLVVIFALDGLPQMRNLSMSAQTNVVEQVMERSAFLSQSMKTGSLISGLVMFQVVLLTLMGSNNSAREIAGERLIFEKEKFAGLRPLAYIASKAAFLSVLVLAQSLWMAVFVNMICHFPGDLFTQALLLVAVNGAMTAICLGISSLMRSAEQASLVSVYLVGFQLPLSGAVLALPEVLGWVTRPFISSYWAWSGYLQTMKDTRYYEAVGNVIQTQLTPVPLCLIVLGAHVVLGLFLAYIGTRSSRWE